MNSMKKLILFALPLLVLSLLAQQKTPPDKIVFEAKTGKVTFDHAAHLKLAKNDCKTCHPKLFPQSREPINFKAAMHKTAETAKSSCAGCHVAGGTAFASKGNCNKCHVKGAAKAG